MPADETFEPRTEEQGQRTPPPRRPPTAVGAATPPPPPPPPRIPRRVRSEPHERPALYYVVGALALIGLAIIRSLKKASGENA